MTDADREMIRRVLDGQDALRESVSQVHVIAAETRASMVGVSRRQEDFIQAHAAFVEETEERTANHSERIDAVALQVHEWKAQQKLILGAASLVGIGGLLTIAGAIVRVFSK